MPSFLPDERARIKEEVLYHSCDLIAAGMRPSWRNLKGRIPDRCRDTIVQLRGELILEGRLVPPASLARWGGDRSECRSRAEFRRYHAEIQKRICLVRAAKIARGEAGGDAVRRLYLG